MAGCQMEFWPENAMAGESRLGCPLLPLSFRALNGPPGKLNATCEDRFNRSQFRRMRS